MTSRRPHTRLKIPIISLRMVRERNVWFSKSVNHPQSLVEMVYPLYKDLDREQIMVVGLDNKNQPTLINVVSIGTINCAPVSPRDVFKPLILSNSSSFLICHNHTSGNLEPSQADIEITKRLKELGEMLQINFLDHIILGDPDNFYSFANVYFQR